jgi:hypothetical protein
MGAGKLLTDRLNDALVKAEKVRLTER